MKIDLYQDVVLTTDVRKYNLYKGDIAKVVDIVQGKGSKPNAYILESYNLLGKTIAVFTLPKHLVEPLSANKVFHARVMEYVF